MLHLSRKQSRTLYLPWLQQLIDLGDTVEVRGKQTKEFLNCVSEVTEPWHHAILLPSRRWNPFLALSEALWILAGRDDVAAIKPYNSHISEYSDDGISLYGAYGARIYNQIDPLIERLRKDPSDRRAVLQIWDGRGGKNVSVNEPGYESLYSWAYDLTAETKDPPCNNMVYFKLRDNKLHMTVINRSNDIHFGLFAVNLPTFGILQSYIAARLGVDMGAQTHFSNSLHVYTDEPRSAAITDRMLYTENEDMPVYPKHDLVFTPNKWLMEYNKHDGFATACSAALENVPLGSGYWDVFPFLQFAREFLTQYRNHEWHPDDLYLKDHYYDWVVAGSLFIDKVWKSNARV